ncbi:MAG: cysteine--tRNA ligase [bacterium]|nr:cysteine--tRNA ligase [bacterium]
MMRIYNTLTSKKEDLKIPPSGEINLFVCGPTVYDYSHIGHARTYIFFDTLVKFMRKRLNIKINYLQNITNIDDRIIKRSAEENKNPQEVADFFEKEYITDMSSLGVNAVDTYAPATKYIPEIISQVERLIKKGFAYSADSSVYFDVRKFPEYGKLSHQKINELKEGVRIEVEAGKKFFADFALWKASKEGEPSWDSPWGKGRPGWHIEDTAITEKYFGLRYNIHGGGLDLIFPHHEAEIAQMEAISGLSPLAEVWIHTGMLLVDGEKMSKSLDNFITIRDFLKENSVYVLRYMVLSQHYRTGLDFYKKTIQMANSSINRIADFKQRLKEVTGQSSHLPWEDFAKTFWHELADDFNTPKALASLFELITETNKLIDTNNLSQNDAQKIVDFIDEVNDILNILPVVSEIETPSQITALLADREKARANKDFELSDKLRDQIKELGWEVEDTAKGPRVTKL